jgi:hypothetical protein
VLILFLMMKKRGENGFLAEDKSILGFSSLKRLNSVSRAAWNRRQLAKMVKLGGMFVSQASA